VAIAIPTQYTVDVQCGADGPRGRGVVARQHDDLHARRLELRDRWFSYDEVADLAVTNKLRTGFELAAVTQFRLLHVRGRR
jgi:hypothetical protein